MQIPSPAAAVYPKAQGTGIEAPSQECPAGQGKQFHSPSGENSVVSQATLSSYKVLQEYPRGQRVQIPLPGG